MVIIVYCVGSDVKTIRTKKSRIQTRDIVQMTRQLATLLHAGVPLLQSFDMLHKGLPPSALQTLIHEIRTHIESGMALNQVLRKHRYNQYISTLTIL